MFFSPPRDTAIIRLMSERFDSSNPDQPHLVINNLLISRDVAFIEYNFPSNKVGWPHLSLPWSEPQTLRRGKVQLAAKARREGGGEITSAPCLPRIDHLITGQPEMDEGINLESLQTNQGGNQQATTSFTRARRGHICLTGHLSISLSLSLYSSFCCLYDTDTFI